MYICYMYVICDIFMTEQSTNHFGSDTKSTTKHISMVNKFHMATND